MRRWFCCALLSLLLGGGGILALSCGSSVPLSSSGVHSGGVGEMPDAKFKVMNWPVERKSARYGHV